MTLTMNPNTISANTMPLSVHVDTAADESASIYRRVLGDDFARLHPKIQERFGVSSAGGIANIGTGVMRKMTRGRAITVPFLRFGTRRNLLFPEHGTNIPFTVSNYAYLDRHGRETITWHRAFDFANITRYFDATMIFSERRGQIVDYLGSHQHIAADLDCWVDEEGGINFRSGEQRCYEGFLRFRFPRALTGHAIVREWYNDKTDRYEISVQVRNPLVGHIIGYRGSFTNEIVPIVSCDDIPAKAMPVREQRGE